MSLAGIRTLVLNQGYEPVRVVNWRRAITMVFLDKATVLSNYDGAEIHSAFDVFPAPAVIWMRNKSRRYVPEVKLSRHYIYARDRWTCQYCGERFTAAQLTFDHVVPRSQGGKTSWENIVTSCEPCNQRKGDQSLKASGMKLLRPPRKPRWMPALLVKSLHDRRVPSEWHDYIGWLLPSDTAVA
jgi:5-methylcytosine-specific restriction endonuclease McrA